MASPIVSHLSVLEKAASLYGSSPAFLIPRHDSQTGVLEGWDPITYACFKQDVNKAALHWLSVLHTDGIPARSVVGMW
jgi:hypothetical protein